MLGHPLLGFGAPGTKNANPNQGIVAESNIDVARMTKNKNGSKIVNSNPNITD